MPKDQTPRTYLNNIIDQYHQESDWSDYEELMNAIEKGCKSTVIDLLAKGYRVVRPGTLNTPLHLAVQRTGWSYVVRRMLNCGAQVGFVNANNDTALHHAFFHAAVDTTINSMVHSYLKDSNDNLVNSTGFTYLHIVCARCKLDYVKKFVEGTNVDVNAQVSMNTKTLYAGFTALHFAVEYGKLDVAAYLLNNNASVYARDANGSTALHLACYNRNVEMVDLLLAGNGAHVNFIDKFGMSHFMAACMGSKTIIVEEHLLVAWRRFNVEPITLVTSKTCDAPTFPFPGYTPLHFAAEYGRLETVKMLLSYGAYCCATTTTTGETPYSLASKRSHVEICEILRQHCLRFQRMVAANQAAPTTLVAQGQGSAGSTGSSTTPDGSGYQDYSSPDTNYSSAPRSCEPCVTPVDLSAAPYYVYDSNY